ncbi:hypothetical protein J3R83DRAFT_7717 [Lanmaoa asiatica]|nr:hypothetical protein J3R83DRAFT_7717 [Lanmaoa asiatica]
MVCALPPKFITGTLTEQARLLSGHEHGEQLNGRFLGDGPPLNVHTLAGPSKEDYCWGILVS